jgi:hypothetical protein
VFLILPVKANIFVPLLFSVPTAAYHSQPLSKIKGTEAYVSTLFIFVGFSNKPFSAGNGGLGVGIPLFPSIDLIKAISSPHTKAPAP